MTLSATARTLGWLVRDTFRQSRAGGIFWILLAISVLAIAVCASADVEGGDAARRILARIPTSCPAATATPRIRPS